MSMDHSEKDHTSITQQQRQALTASWPGVMNWDVSMADYCTLKAGGKAEALAVVSSRQELQQLVNQLGEQKIAWRVIGRGSNILITDKGFGGVLIILGGEFSSVSSRESDTAGKTMVNAGAGCPVSRLVGWCTQQSLSGLEFMSGIPGSVGGAVRMNAGAWGCEIGERIVSVSFVDTKGRLHIVPGSEMDFSYRRMTPRDKNLENGVIIAAAFFLSPGRQRDIFKKCREYQARRRVKQPLGVATAGSFFRNPEEDSAGRLIEAAGLKGMKKGNAMVSTKHANFIVNTGEASADDIIELMNEIRQRVFDFSGIMLEPEVHVL